MDWLRKTVVGMLKSASSAVAGVSLKAKGEMKMSKRIFVGLLIGMMVFAVPAMADVGPSESMTLTVTVAPAVSVWIGQTTYAFGNLGVDAISVAGASCAVINDSSGLTEKYALRASGAIGADDTWTLNAYSAEAEDAFTLCAIFNTAEPSAFGSTDHDLTNIDQTCDETLFAGTEDGYDVLPAAQQNLWFEINTPTIVNYTNVHTIYVTITASAAY